MFKSIRIRTKLAAALAVPLLALVGVAGYEVASATRGVDEARAESRLATASVGPGSLILNLQEERNRASIDLIGMGDAVDLPTATNEEARALTDESLAELQRLVAGAGEEVQAAYAASFDGLAELEDLRRDIDAWDGPTDLTNVTFANEVYSRYTTAIEALFESSSAIARSVDHAELRNGVEIIDASARSGDLRAHAVRTILLALLTDTADDPAAIADAAAIEDAMLRYDELVRQNAVGAFAGIADTTFEEDTYLVFNEQLARFVAGQGVDVDVMLGSVVNDPEKGFTALRARAAETLEDVAKGLEDDATARQRLFVLIAAVGLVLAVVITWLASRSITRPLVSLKEQAEHMAETSLPAAVHRILETPPGEDVMIPAVEPVVVKSRDEVADVAKAIGTVQRSALDLAVEQAILRRNISDSYVNLGRRNQNLLSRQLDFITELERNESDPDTLEGLFRLDHLATRMRRNAESLLVLAGIEPPRQWSAPVAVGDIVRGALGEVEDYQRVAIRNMEAASVAGSVASDLAHIIAELTENALSFSPPDEPVEVRGRVTLHGYTLAISDNGMGMSEAELDRANRRLAGDESFTVAPSRYLGHYVAGHLAKRIGVRVELHDSPAGGVTARIDIPGELLAGDGFDEAPAPAALAPDAPVVEPSAEPMGQGPTSAPAPTSFTESGLPRRGGAPVEEEISPAPEPAWSALDHDPLPPVVAAPPEPPAPPAAPAPSVAPLEERAQFDWSVPSEPPSAPAVDEPAPAAEVPPPPPPAPSEDGPAVPGLGGLVPRPVGPSMFSVAAEAARRGEPVNPAGLTRRVPGAQRPDVPIGGARPEADDAVPDDRSTPEDVYAFLSSFQSGVSRGRAELDSTEEDR